MMKVPRDTVFHARSRTLLVQFVERFLGSELAVKKISEKEFLLIPIDGVEDPDNRIWTPNFLTLYVLDTTIRNLQSAMRYVGRKT
jgi:hypothetical protein